MSLLKKFVTKRIGAPNLAIYALQRQLRGFRKKQTALKHSVGEYVFDCNYADHIHCYLSLRCRFKCKFCINRHLADDKLPWANNITSIALWSDLLNRLYNVRELLFNGGEHFLIDGFSDLINSLDGFSITVFTNLPPQGMDEFKNLKNNRKSNLIIKCSYHPQQEGPIGPFIERYQQIPKRILKHVHIIKAPGVSTEMYIDRFRRCGIFATANDLVMLLNKDKPRRTITCRPNEHIVGPDMKIHRCVVRMIKGAPGEDINDYDFNHNYIECNYYPFCEGTTAYNDVKV